MRSALCCALLGLVSASPLPAAEVPAKPPTRTVYLNGPADLDRLRTSNPGHYSQAQRILGAANELCRPGPEEVRFVRLDVRDLQCSRMLLKTSNPPKWNLSFRLDDVRYIALVTVTDDPPRPVHAK